MFSVARWTSYNIDRFQRVQRTLHGQSLDLDVWAFRLDFCNFDRSGCELISEDLIDGHSDRSHSNKAAKDEKSSDLTAQQQKDQDAKYNKLLADFKAPQR